MGGHHPTNSRARKRTLSGSTLVFSLLVTVFASFLVKQGIEKAAVRQFIFTCDQVTLKIQERLGAYALILHGGGALFAATVSVERKEWQTYVENLQAEQSVPGVQGIGFAQVIPANQLTNHIAKIRSEGFPDYTVKPPGERTVYTSIIYLEPFRDRNLRAFGYDMYTEPVRRCAMEKARDTGEATLSGKVILVQETGTDNQAGVLMYVPVYRNGAPISTVEQRRSALVGWVYSPYRMNDLMVGILGDWEQHEGKTVDLAIYDGSEATHANLLLDNQPTRATDVHSLFYQQRTIDFNGHPWLLELDYIGQLSALSYLPAWATLAGGLALSGLLFGLMRSVINTRINAARIAEGLTTEIRQAQKKLHLLLNSTAEAIYGIDTDGNCTFCNDACLRLLGYRHPDDLLGKNMHWQIHGKYADGTHFPVEECRIFQAVKKGERMHVDDEVLWRSDGTSFPAEYWSYPESDKGEVVGAVVTFLDISERKRLEDAINKSRNLLLKIIDTAPIRVFWKDLNLRYLGCNKAFAKDAGMRHPQDMIGKDDYQMGWATQAELYRTDDRAVMESGIAKLYYVEPQTTPDGQEIWLRSSKIPLRNQNNQVFGLLGVYEDITERKRLEDEREKALKQLYKIANQVPGVVYQYQLRTDGSFCFPFASAGIRDIYRVTPEEVREDAAKVFAVIHPDDYDAVQSTIFESARNLTPWRQEYRVKFDDGTVHWLFGDAMPERETDGSTLWYGFITDITERKRMQDDLALREAEMRTTLYSIGDAVISLDINACVLLMNPVAEQLTGWSEPEAHGKPLEEVLCIINEKTRAKIDNPVTLALNKDSKVDMMSHTVLIARDGTERPIGDSAAPIFDQDHQLTGVVLVFRDLTKERAAEAAIQDAREYAENIVETMREPLLVLNYDLKILTANPSFYNTFKVTPEKTIGNFIYDLGDRQWDIPKLRVLIEDILPNATVFNNYEVDHDFPGIGRKFILLNAREIVREGIGSRIILLAMEDITERKQLENERWALFNKITSRVPGIIYQYRLRPDGNSCMPFASEAIRELFRVSPEEAREDASKVFAIIHTDDYSSTVASLQESAQNLTPWRHEYRIKFDDGTICWMFGDALPERETDGSTLWHGFITDITERKRMQDDIALNEAEMRTTLYSIGDAVISLDINACVLLMNPVAEQLTGWSESEAHGKPLEEVFCIINEKTRAKIDNPVTLVLNSGRNVAMMVHTILIARDGTERSIGDSAAPIFDQDHQLTGVVLVFRDLTKERAAEEVILDQLAIIETYQGLVALADLDGKLIYINAGGTKLLGATQAEEILAKNMTDLLEPTDFKRVTDEALQVAIKDRVWNGEHTLKRIDSTSIPVSQTVFPIHDAEGNLRHIGMIITDISLQKAMQEKLLISEKLAVMGRLVADVSHEINNPLAIIIGRTQLMLSHSDGQQLPLKSQLETVLLNAERCKTILSNLLTYSRTIGKQEVAVNLPDLIKEAVDAVTYQYDMSTIEVTVACNLPAYTKITGNKDALLSVFINLIRNARQAMAQTGKLTITVAKENESQLRIEIHDTGIGISKEQLEKIFQPFNSGWQQDKGTGLGLVTSLGIIETHGGKLWAESAGEGQGTKFIILLPHRNRKTQVINGLED